MFTKFKTILAAVSLFLVCSCDTLRDDYSICGVWLEFIFDHNMRYEDSFEAHVKMVDLYVFDSSGTLVLSRHSDIAGLSDGNRMFLGGSLPFGTYRILAVGNLYNPFRFTDKSGDIFTPGVTTIEDVELALDTSLASEEFDHLFFGGEVDIDYKADLSVYRLPLIRETNKFNIILQTESDASAGVVAGLVDPVHTVEIVCPESGSYDWQNNATSLESLVYHPYSISCMLVEETEGALLRETTVNLNTMRLLESKMEGYRIIIRDIASGEEMWSRNFLSLLAGSKPARRPDGSALPLSEYLDREGEWTIVIVYGLNGEEIDNPDPVDPDPTDPGIPGGPSGNTGAVALKIIVNNWIVWINDIGV